MKIQPFSLSVALVPAVLTPYSYAFTRPSSLSHSYSSVRRRPLLILKAVAKRSDSETALNAVMVDSEESTARVERKESQQRKVEAAYLKDGFVFGLEGSGLERPKGRVANVVVEGDSLETQPYQIAMVAGTFLGHAFFALTAFNRLLEQNGGNLAMTSVQICLLAISSWLLADLGSGVLHWSVDNYGNGRTPIMGNIIAAFQGHHSAPWTIAERGFCNNVYKLCIPFGVVPMTLINMISGPAVTMFFTCFCVTEIMSQEFHKWAHMTKGQCSPLINWLQDAGFTIGRKPHALHHMAPYEGNYCIISGVCNKPLDRSGIFRWMEHQIYKMNGIESNAWKLDPELRERTLRGEYGPPDNAKQTS